MSGKEKEPGKPGKKKKLLIGAGIIMLAAAAGTGATVWYLSERGEIQQREGAPEMELSFGEDVITAGGSTSVGMQEENFELDYIDTELVIEEVYLSSQDEVEAGTAILKLMDESVETARRELEEKATQADLDYREALLDGEEEKITAQQTLDTSLLNGTYATYTYEESLKEYEEEIESLQEQIEEAQELVDEYTASIESDYYYTYYEVAEKEEELNSTFAALMQLYEEWDVAELEDHNQAATIGGSSGESGEAASDVSSGASDMSGADGAGASGGGMGAQGGSGGGASNDSTKLTVYDMLDEEVQENEAAYEEALENYEDAKATAEASLAQAQTNLELLKIQLEEAQIEYEKQQVSSQSDYDAAVSESGSAQETWQTEIERIDDEISVALNAKEEADENLQEFEEVIGDGYLYTTSAGTVMMVNVREETDLTGGSMVLAYSNPETVTVTASNDTLTMLLVCMAVIVFIVGGLGIMNVLFVSVKERTNEIGILKAIGCTKKDILAEFLMEASCTSLLGAILGVMLALGLTPALDFGVTVSLSVSGGVLSLIFGVLTGTVFGFYPAYQASNLIPVEALNHE